MRTSIFKTWLLLSSATLTAAGLGCERGVKSGSSTSATIPAAYVGTWRGVIDASIGDQPEENLVRTESFLISIEANGRIQAIIAGAEEVDRVVDYGVAVLGKDGALQVTKGNISLAQSLYPNFYQERYDFAVASGFSAADAEKMARQDAELHVEAGKAAGKRYMVEVSPEFRISRDGTLVLSRAGSVGEVHFRKLRMDLAQAAETIRLSRADKPREGYFFQRGLGSVSLFSGQVGEKYQLKSVEMDGKALSIDGTEKNWRALVGTLNLGTNFSQMPKFLTSTVTGFKTDVGQELIIEMPQFAYGYPFVRQELPPGAIKVWARTNASQKSIEKVTGSFLPIDNHLRLTLTDEKMTHSLTLVYGIKEAVKEEASGAEDPAAEEHGSQGEGAADPLAELLEKIGISEKAN